VYNVLITNLLLSFNSEKTLIGNQRVEKLRERQRLTSTLLRVANSPVFLHHIVELYFITDTIVVNINSTSVCTVQRNVRVYIPTSGGREVDERRTHTSTVIVLSLRAADVA